MFRSRKKNIWGILISQPISALLEYGFIRMFIDIKDHTDVFFVVFHELRKLRYLRTV